VVLESKPAVDFAGESDDEFAELAREARRERQQKELLAEQFTTSDVNGISSAIAPGGASNINSAPDPVVQVLIDSPISDTNPLIVHRKLSQRLQEVRHAWCQKQGFSDARIREVFFIHRMRKVYDATTCRSLGLSVDVFGNIVMKGAEDKEGADKVHLQAVTEREFDAMKAEREAEAKRRRGELPAEEEPGLDDEVAAVEEEEVRIRLVLKAKGRRDFKLIVKPVFLPPVHLLHPADTFVYQHTAFSKIVSAYCKSMDIDTGQDIFAEFDGDRLDPHDVVQNTEISDLDVLNIHIGS
jgi:hypothetical protein